MDEGIVHVIAKRGAPTVLFYAVVVPVILLAKRYCPSGPCTPNLDVLSILIALPVGVVLCLRNMGRALNRQCADYLIPAAMHAAAVIILMLFFI